MSKKYKRAVNPRRPGKNPSSSAKMLELTLNGHAPPDRHKATRKVEQHPDIHPMCACSLPPLTACRRGDA